ncbi:heterokaryon incompatibility protein-domain-containing protein, partial [Staphylotrichum tortipilum]
SPAATSGDVFGIGPLHDSSSGDSLSVLRDWMAECISNHSCGCPNGGASREDETANPALPTRILDISTDSSGSMTVRLVESHKIRGRYAALSHCWGPPDKQPLRTTKALYGQHLIGIPVSDLPKTFQEAARIAQATGLRYLWIDSLCIIQDDRDDWNREAPRMGPLYGKASLVIAASGATNSTEGCFVPRSLPGRSLRIPYPSAGGGGHIVLQVRPPYAAAMNPVFSPLGRRGWVLQEWMLARRLVHYTAAGMTWSCKEVQNMVEDGLHMTTTTPGGDELNWDDIIEAYTTRQLTLLSDKTVAVQGLAEAMQRPDATYHHGMWTSDMPQQLFWIGTHTTRPEELRDFPSWSWASTDGRCLTLSQRKLSWETLPAVLEVEGDGRELAVSCRARRCSLKQWQEFSHRAVTEPPLARAAAAGSIMQTLPIHYTGKMTHSMLDDDTGAVVGIAMLDDVDAAGECVQDCVSAFLMKEVRQNNSQTEQAGLTSCSLVLQSVGPGVHRRLGVGFVVDEDWVQGAIKQALRIV